MSPTSRLLLASLLLTAGCDRASASTLTAVPTVVAAPTSVPSTPPDTPPTAPTTPPAADYHWEIHKATNLKFELPTSWSVSQKGNVLVAESPTQGVGIEFMGATGGVEAKNDEKAMLATVGKTLQGARFTSKMKPAQQHGLKGFVATGTGKKNGGEVSWFTSAIGDGKGHAMLTLGIYLPTASPASRAQMVRILDSIQPAS